MRVSEMNDLHLVNLIGKQKNRLEDAIRLQEKGLIFDG
jgi:hypothetical protein